MKTSTAFIFITLLVAAGCERIEYFPDNPVAFVKTYTIAHQGGGNFDAGNTFEACKHGLEHTEGIEVDVQRSLANTLWLNHEASIEHCGSFKESCFASLDDNTIIAIDTCRGPDRNYTKLESVFEYMATHYPEKFISIDVKPWKPCGVSNLNVIRQMNQMADAIISLTDKYNMGGRVMVESQVGDFLYHVRTHSDNIETYLVTLGDLELGISRALEGGFSGVSFAFKYDEPITRELVDLLHRKGLKIQLWTVEPTDLEEASSLGPDFIQTDYF